MNKYKWSAKYNAFFPIEMLPAYQSSWDDLSDLIDIDDTVEAEFNGESPVGKVRGVVDGMPAWVDIPPLHHDDIVTNAESFKQMLINSALQSINVIQLKLQSGRLLTEIEKTKLDTALDYIDAVNAIDTSTAPNIEWPIIPAELAS